MHSFTYIVYSQPQLERDATSKLTVIEQTTRASMWPTFLLSGASTSDFVSGTYIGVMHLSSVEIKNDVLLVQVKKLTNRHLT